MNIAVFCSSNDLSETYTKPAKRLAELLAHNGHAMVYGGSEYGLMKVMADVAQQAGARLVAITTPPYDKYVRKAADEIIRTKTLGERKTEMLAHSDIIVVLVGGLGTLDETTEVLELRKQDRHDKLIIVLNTAGFYDGLKTQLERMNSEGFFKMGEQVGARAKSLESFISFVNTPEEVFEIIA